MKSQNEQIHAALKRGPVTQAMAVRYMDCYRLAARIHDLKAQGVAIRTEMVQQNGKRFARYRLAS